MIWLQMHTLKLKGKLLYQMLCGYVVISRFGNILHPKPRIQSLHSEIIYIKLYQTIQ